MASKNIMTLTPAAVDHIRELLRQREKAAKGVRISIKTKGCNGKAYSLEYVDEPDIKDEVIHVEDVTLFIDPKATLFIIGTEMDFVEETMQSGFVFRNPNAKGTCGCGESFNT